MSLPGIDSFSFTPAPKMVSLNLESSPAGALATTSAGPSCTTPCTVNVAAVEGLSVAFTLDKYQPATVPVQVTDKAVPSPYDNGAPVIERGLEPNPVTAVLEAIPQPKKKKKPAPKSAKHAARPAASKPAPAQAPVASNASPFPAPASGFPQQSR